jgi:hypothetical protein
MTPDDLSPPTAKDGDTLPVTLSATTPNAGPTKTPMYEAIHAARYHRQALIKSIQEEYGRRLICYVSGKLASIDRDDTAGFMEILHNIQPGDNVDLLLHTGGGDDDAAEKLMTMVQATVTGGQFRAIIPDFAKSAGTLIVLGADALLMSDSSELRGGRRGAEENRRGRGGDGWRPMTALTVLCNLRILRRPRELGPRKVSWPRPLMASLVNKRTPRF